MPRPANAQRWIPDCASQEWIDILAWYTTVAEKSSAAIRSRESVPVQWATLDGTWKSNPSRYPIVLPQQDDLLARQMFLKKCQTFCSVSSSKTEECVH